ncbi:MAG: TRAP transporter substrate-binding protein DctP, partial [Burkholderiales bacterium]
MNRKVLIALATTGMLGAQLAPQALAADTVMRVSHQLPPRHHIAQIIDAWAQDIEKRSNGSIDVQVFGANQLFKPRENFPAVAKGDAECALSVNFQWGKTIPEMNVTLRPYSVTDLAVLRKWPGSEPAGQLEAMLEKKGVRNVVWLFTTNMSAITSNGKFLKAPDDFKGIKIRGLNALVDSGLRAMGAAPASMPGSQVYQALQTGVIDAGLTDVSAAYSRKYYEVQDHAVATPMFSVFFHGYCNPRWLDGLSAEQRAAVEAASAAAAEAAVAKTESAASEAPDQLRAKGMKVHIHTPAETAAFKAAMLPAFDAEFDKSTGGA